MKTTLGIAIASAVVVFGAGLAGAATVSSDVHALKLISASSSAAQHVGYRHWRHHRCWWSHGHRHCRYW